MNISSNVVCTMNINLGEALMMFNIKCSFLVYLINIHETSLDYLWLICIMYYFSVVVIVVWDKLFPIQTVVLLISFKRLVLVTFVEI